MSNRKFITVKSVKYGGKRCASAVSIQLSREGFTLPELPGKTGRAKIRAAIARRQVFH